MLCDQNHHSGPEAKTQDSLNNDLSRIYTDPVLIKTIFDAQVPIQLVKLGSSEQRAALKVFYYHEDKISEYFLNEIRFVGLTHKNIITIYHSDFLVKQIDPHTGQDLKVSRIFMEYAPNGDLFEAVKEMHLKFDEKLARTYFKKMIDGLEYLHSHGIAHLDLKPENLVLDENFELKITDFDLSFIAGDKAIKSTGTCDYRALELLFGKCENPYAADIYSMAIILFFMKTNGKIPFPEEKFILFEIIQKDEDLFWNCHLQALGKENAFFSKSFRDLFVSMIKEDPKERARIEDIKNSDWFKEDAYNDEELKDIMKKWFQMQN